MDNLRAYENLHPLLRRQLKKAGLPDAGPIDESGSWNDLLRHVNAAYLQSDQDRYTLERSISISSREMQELNRSLKTSQALLEHERDRLDGILGSLKDVVWSVSPDQSNMHYVNPAFSGVYGRPGAELLVDPGLWMRMVHSDDSSQVAAAIERMNAEGFAEAEYRIIKPSGEVRWIHHKMQLIRNNGEPMRIDAICSDVTEKKAVDMEIIKSKEAAEAAVKVKTQFLANMSHEIRTPMNGIMGMAQLLLDSELTEKQRHLGQVIMESSNALMTVINDILDISKIEYGKLELKMEPFLIRKNFEDVAALLRPLAIGKGLSMKISVGADIPEEVMGDSARLRQVLMNLLGNAIKFTDSGEVVFLTELDREEKRELVIKCEIKDTGIGIDPASTHLLFHPFSQIDGSTTRRHGGAGLGLFISKQLVELMGGTIGYASRRGEGSHFWFTFKVGKVNEMDMRTPDNIDSHLGRAEGSRQDAASDRVTDMLPSESANRILVVEDNPMNQKVIRLMLEHLGFACEIAQNGEEALLALTQSAYELIFMDCQMPVMDGYEAVRKIRASDMLRNNIIIAMTAHAMLGDREKCLAAGMDDYIGKPITFESLSKMLDKWTRPISAEQ